jgi:predicted signal transduction protein with EAL and GGDEF domain
MIYNRDSRKIVAAVIGLGQSLGLITVAEGIEDRTQADMLQWLGCDLARVALWTCYSRRRDRRCSGCHNAHPRRTTDSEISNLVTSVEALPSRRRAESQAIYDARRLAPASSIGICAM